MNIKQEYLATINKVNDLKNDSYNDLTDASYNQTQLQHDIYEAMNRTDWEAESKYHNYYYTNGRDDIGRTIKMNNKKWHTIQKN